MTTDTSTGAAIRLHAADEDDAELEARVAEEDEFRAQVTGDEVEPFEARDADEDYSIDSIMDLEAEDEDPFETLDELLELEEAEMVGRWVRWDKLPDAEFNIAHLAAALDKKGKLELKYREKKGLTYAKVPEGGLRRVVEERLWRQALFGTAVKGWRGESMKGRPFNERNFLHLMEKSRRFKTFIYHHTGTVDDLRKKMQEDAAGN